MNGASAGHADLQTPQKVGGHLSLVSANVSQRPYNHATREPFGPTYVGDSLWRVVPSDDDLMSEKLGIYEHE